MRALPPQRIPGLHPASPMCPDCGREYEYRVRPKGTSGEADYYGCGNGHEWDRLYSWAADLTDGQITKEETK